MLLESKSALSSPPAALKTRRGWLPLGIGVAVSLVAVHGRWDIPAAAWIFSIFLLRFARTHSVRTGFAGLWAAYAVSAAFYLYESGLPVLSPMLLLCLSFGTVLVLPYLLDRLVTPRLGSTWLATLVFPAGVVGAEYFLAAVSPLGTALSSLAATQHENLPLIQLASVTGSYGISFLMAWFAATAVHVWEQRLAWPRVRTAVLTLAAVLTLVIVSGTVRLAFFAPTATTVRVAGVSVAATVQTAARELMVDRGSPGDLSETGRAAVRRAFALRTDDLLASTERETRAGAKLVVWPEAATGSLDADRDELLAKIGAVAARTGSYIAAGLVVLTDQAPYSRNEAVLFDPQGQVVWTYEKTHPVPGMDMIEPGDGIVPTTDTAFGRVANVICFDADFPGLSRQARGVDLMLVPSNDWAEFGQTHTEKATLRAVENGYSLVRQDSHGLSRTFDPQGRALASTDYFTSDQQTMVAYVPTKGVSTIYNKVGDVFSWLCLAGLAGLSLGAIRRRRT